MSTEFEAGQYPKAPNISGDNGDVWDSPYYPKEKDDVPTADTGGVSEDSDPNDETKLIVANGNKLEAEPSDVWDKIAAVRAELPSSRPGSKIGSAVIKSTLSHIE